ncbi:unnamed protein product [Paramecium primaurelia]|uniref:Uncharacterized protein n=1 Tax=Paramecium primaurelia TaxID=5886 RepID=A0A8S1LT91_PARPR|nr:unnamed protein product [Paramecium primaurelia]
MDQDSMCQTHNQPTIGYYYDQKDKPHHFCSDCDLVNLPSRIYYYLEIINDKSKINDQKQKYIQQYLNSIKSINKKLQNLMEKKESECIDFDKELKKMEEAVQNKVSLTNGQITKLQDFQNYNINLVYNDIYTLCNQYFEDHYQNIYNTSQAMQNDIPQLLNTILINNSDQKNLALYNLKLNLFINKQVQSLKNRIQEIFLKNAEKINQEQDKTKRDEFYFQIESDKYYIRDISQLIIDIRDYIDISSKNIFYQSDIEKQLNDYKSAEAQNNDQTENNDTFIIFSEVDDFYIQNEQLE